MLYILLSPSTKLEVSIPMINDAASINSDLTSIAAETAAFAFMNVTLLEYEPRSTGDVSDSFDLILIMSIGRPNTSATA